MCAYCGCRLEEETFADCVIDDYSAINKRTVSGNEDILLVECTDFTASKNVDFDKAVKHGKDNLLDSGSFICAVDVRRSRAGGLRPIPQKIANNQFQGNARLSGNSTSGTQQVANRSNRLRGRLTFKSSNVGAKAA